MLGRVRREVELTEKLLGKVTKPVDSLIKTTFKQVEDILNTPESGKNEIDEIFKGTVKSIIELIKHSKKINFNEHDLKYFKEKLELSDQINPELLIKGVKLELSFQELLVMYEGRKGVGNEEVKKFIEEICDDNIKSFLINGKELNLIKMLLRVPDDFDMSMLTRGLRLKATIDDLEKLFNSQDNISNSKTKDLVRGIILDNLNKGLTYENLRDNDIKTSISEAKGFIDEVKTELIDINEIFKKLIEANSIKVIIYTINLLLNSDELKDSEKVRILEILVEENYGISSRQKSNIILSLLDINKDQLDILKKGFRKNSSEINENDLLTYYNLLKNVKSNTFKYLIYNKLLGHLETIPLITKISKKDNGAFLFFRNEVLGIYQPAKVEIKEWDIFEDEGKSSIKEGIDKLKNLFGSEKIKQQKIRKIAKEKLFSMLGIANSVNKIPTPEQMFDIISNTDTYEGRRILYELYFKEIKGITIDYNIIFDLILKENSVKSISDFNNNSLVRFLKLNGDKRGVFGNLSYLFKKIKITNINQIVGGFFEDYAVNKTSKDFESFVNKFPQKDGKIDESAVAKLLKSDIETILYISNLFNEVDYSNITKLRNLMDFLDTTSRRNFGKIRRNLGLFKKLFPEITIRDLDNSFFHIALETYNSNILEFFLTFNIEHLSQKDEQIYDPKLEPRKDINPSKDYVVALGGENRKTGRDIINSIRDDFSRILNKSHIEAPEHTKIKYADQGRRFFNFCNLLYLNINFQDFIKNTENKFFMSSEVPIENIIVGLFKCKEKLIIRMKKITIDEKDYLEVDNLSLKALGEKLGEMANERWEPVDLAYFGLNSELDIGKTLSKLFEKLRAYEKKKNRK